MQWTVSSTPNLIAINWGPWFAKGLYDSIAISLGFKLKPTLITKRPFDMLTNWLWSINLRNLCHTPFRIFTFWSMIRKPSNNNCTSLVTRDTRVWLRTWTLVMRSTWLRFIGKTNRQQFHLLFNSINTFSRMAIHIHIGSLWSQLLIESVHSRTMSVECIITITLECNEF